MKKSLFLLMSLLFILTGCQQNQNSNPSVSASTVNSSDFAFDTKWTLEGFKMPESVFASSSHPWLYVSNVNGAAPGFISRVSKDGTIDNLEWTTGLTAPTGSDMYKNQLYVADVKQLHIIDVEKAEIIKSYAAEDAVSLNDVAIHPTTGQVFISDVPGGKIYTLENDKLSVWLESINIPFPNGVFVQDNSLIVANYGKKNGEGLMRKEWKPDDYGALYSIDISSKELKLLKSSDKKGVFDGVTLFNGVLMASSNPTGQVLTFEDATSHLIDTSSPGIADINTDGKTIYAPYLFGNKLVAFEKVAWDRITTKEEYLEKGADNYFGDAGGMSIATSGGIIKGNFGGQQLKGTWDWQDEYFCRTSTLGSMDLGSDCIQIDVTKNKMRLILNKGKGMSVVYDKKNDPEITILSTFKIKPEQIDLYKKEMLDNQDIVRKEDGTLEMKLFQDKNNAENFLVFGRNASKETLESHSEDVEKRGIADRVKNALTEAPKSLFLTNQKPLPSEGKEIKTPSSENVILFFTFDVKEGYKDKLTTQLIKHTELTRQEEGNLRFDFYINNEKENSFVILEHWKNEAAGDIHRAQSYTKETEKLMRAAIDESTQKVYFVNQIEK